MSHLMLQDSFFCVAMFKAKMIFEIADKPRWSNEHVEGAYGFIGGKVNLSCSALAEPGADFTWIKDNRTIQTGDDVEIFNATRHLSILQVRRSPMAVTSIIHSGNLKYW
jgi:Immunoglobulin domain